jgi:hypothetical protein
LHNTSFYGERGVAAVHDFVEREAGVKVESAKNSSQARCRALAIYYKRMAAAIPTDVRFHHHHSALRLGNGRQVQAVLRARQPVELAGVRFWFGTNYDAQQAAILLAVNARDHLISYYELRERPDPAALLAAYTAEGRVLKGSRSQSKASGVKIKSPRQVGTHGAGSIRSTGHHCQEASDGQGIRKRGRDQQATVHLNSERNSGATADRASAYSD